MSYSPQQLKEIAQTDLQELLRIINNHHKMDIKTVALAIDVLGEDVKDETIVLPIVKRLLNHIHVLIRESAIICIATFYEDKSPPKDIIDKLRNMAHSDPSNDLRDLAKDTLKDLS